MNPALRRWLRSPADSASHPSFNRARRGGGGKRPLASNRLECYTVPMNLRPGAVVAILVSILMCASIPSYAAEAFDLVILNGRVMDPESGLDAVRHVGVRGGTIEVVSEALLKGRKTIDAQGLVVAPGFIDLHQHAMDGESWRLKAFDGVTTAFELEVGAADVDRWYADQEGKRPINYGVSVGHIKVRMSVMGDRPSFLPGSDSGAATRRASAAQLDAIKAGIEKGLKRGAVAVGFGLAYTPNATPLELMEMFRVAAKHRASSHVHMRHSGHLVPGAVEGLQELVAAAAITGAPLHIVHIQSTGKRMTPDLLKLVAEAQSNGLDISAECYPYTAGMTDIRAAIFDPGWREKFGLDYSDMQWGATGERLNEETFHKYRKQGGLVILHTNPEKIVTEAVAHPSIIVASDGLKGHPRNVGTFCRVVGHYVRAAGALELMDALRKITLMPAQRLEARVPDMKKKGRVRVGADADLVVFDPKTVTDRATYTEALRASVGVRHLLVGGKVVIAGGKLDEALNAGRPVRAPISR